MKNDIIRVAQIMGKWNGGGVESVVMNYYKHINRNKIQFDFICDQDSISIPYDEIKQLGGKVILIPPYQKMLKYQKQLKKILTEGNYKIVHSHISTLSIFPLFAARRAKVPIRIVHSHSTTNKKEWIRNFLKQILRPFSKVFATDYFCCSELSGRWLFGNRTYNQGKVYLLNNAIDVEKFFYNEQIRNRKRKELNIKEDTLVIGHIGRFVQQKNHEFLIQVFHEIYKQNKNSILLLVGQGPLQDKIEKQVDSLGIKESVKFLGQRKDVNELYQAMDVFVLPSLYEGLPVVGIEAQATGLLCIFSSDMTKETKVLDTTGFIKLDIGEKRWAEIILEKAAESKRTAIEVENFKEFNIENQGRELSEKYIRLIEETNRKE